MGRNKPRSVWAKAMWGDEESSASHWADPLAAPKGLHLDAPYMDTDHAGDPSNDPIDQLPKKPFRG